MPNGEFARATVTSSPNNAADRGASSGGLSGGQKAAIGASIGGVAIIALLAGVYFFLRRRRKQAALSNETRDRKKTEIDESQRHYGHEAQEAPVPIKYTHTDFHGPSELQAEETPQELDGSRRAVETTSPVELPGESTELRAVVR